MKRFLCALAFAYLAATSLSSAQTTITWNGGGTGVWSDPNDWGGAGIPNSSNNILDFTGTSAVASDNNIAGLTVQQINFGGAGSNGFNIYDQAITLGQAGGPSTTVTVGAGGSAIQETIGFDVTLGMSQTWNSGPGILSAGLYVEGAINTNGFTLTSNSTTVYGNEFVGVISGSGGLVAAGGESTYLSGNNTYTGTTLVSTGSSLFMLPTATIAGNVLLGGGGGTGVLYSQNATVGGSITANNSGNLAPLDNLYVNGDVILNAGSTYGWYLNTNTAIGTGTAGTDWGLLKLTGSNNLTFTNGGGVGESLALGFNNSQGDPNSGGALWTTNQQWEIADLNTGILDYSGLSISNASWTTGDFSLSNIGNDLFLNWTIVPEPGSIFMIVGGLALLGCVGQRRRS